MHLCEKILLYFLSLSFLSPSHLITHLVVLICVCICVCVTGNGGTDVGRDGEETPGTGRGGKAEEGKSSFETLIMGYVIGGEESDIIGHYSQ